MIAALYVQADGVYLGLPDVELWPVERDARTYAGPWPVVAHPPCQRWGRFFHGSTRRPHQFVLGDDGGCFAAALASVREWGGVLEHPEGSHAWAHFGLNKPPRDGGWISADFEGGWTCCVEQRGYGHYARKPTWLYAAKVVLPDLRWGKTERRLDPAVVERMGLKRAIRLGEVGGRGGGRDSTPRIHTPDEFRDLLISIARSVKIAVAA
jgi:hypothetical protein